MFKYVLAVASLLLAIPQFATAQTSQPPIKAKEYCASTGGAVQERTPEYGTNGGTPLVLAGPRDYCQYLSADGTTQIDVLLSTLVATKPSLAALAYYSQTKVNLKRCQGGPGSCYCADVGGTDSFGGISLAGGGWVLNSNVNDVLDVCVFPDLSAIDAYGLFYHAYGIIRGQNLAHKFRFPNPY